MKKVNEQDLIERINEEVDFVVENAYDRPEQCAANLRLTLEYATRLFCLKQYGTIPVWGYKDGEKSPFNPISNEERFKKHFSDVTLGDIKLLYQICSDVLHGEYKKTFNLKTVTEFLQRLNNYFCEIEELFSIKILKQEIDVEKLLHQKQDYVSKTFDKNNTIIQASTYQGDEIYEEPKDFNYIIFKIKEDVLKNREHGDLYEATRKYWKVKYESVIKYKYAFTVMNGVVQEVFFIKGWIGSPVEKGRLEFIGEYALDEIRQRFKGKKTPEYYRKKGMASPVLFSKN